MSTSPLQDVRRDLSASWVNFNDLHHRRSASSNIAGSWCMSASSETRSSSSSPKVQRPRTSHWRNNRNMMTPRAERVPAIVGVRKPLLIVDPLLFPEEDSQDLRNCKRVPAQILAVDARVKQVRSNTPAGPPPTPAPQRLPTPDLPELECDVFCDCCATQKKPQSTKEVMVSREKTGRKRETALIDELDMRALSLQQSLGERYSYLCMTSAGLQWRQR
ncbi:hypothetical protein FGG08_006565 [Glutinoglossum americanum]|uniref:Uncharacterized protein n=1 Tax=Glutinoglossum americanum TaxID=1670608 RepID=A0A9P8I1A4_9PEZI|nr:hypothetical protein FGG08_006565 [Glutinoglossum americanum]